MFRSSLFRLFHTTLLNRPRILQIFTLTFGFYVSNQLKISMDSPKIAQQNNQEVVTAQSLISKTKQVQVCDSKDIAQGQIFPLTVKNIGQIPYEIIIIRYRGILYAISGNCTFEQTWKYQPSATSLKQGICFNNKLYCPNHGCAFNIETGSVQHGPARNNLPRFQVRQNGGRVVVFHPEIIPNKIVPKYSGHNLRDFRKAVIIGEDYYAMMGCVDALRQYDFTGEINFITQSTDLPLRIHQLHKSVVNLKKTNQWDQQNQSSTSSTSTSSTSTSSTSTSSTSKRIKLSEQQIHSKLDQLLYRKLQYQTEQWLDYYGIDRTFTDQSFRIINKRFYPYLNFDDGTKIQYDAMLLAPKIWPQNSSLKKKKKNIFLPYRNKKQHRSLMTFLNIYSVQTMLVFGLNRESLQFIDAVKRQFPKIQIKVIDQQKRTITNKLYGHKLQQRILKYYIEKGIQFYINVSQDVQIKNNFSPNSGGCMSIELDPKKTLKGECAVLFPSSYIADTVIKQNYVQQCIRRRSKYTDTDFTSKHLIITNPFTRTDTKRIFAGGAGSSSTHFYIKKRVSDIKYGSCNHTTPIQVINRVLLPGQICQLWQGYNQYQNIPLHYIPVQVQQFAGRRLWSIDFNQPHDRIYMKGNIQQWDFLNIYVNRQDEIIGVNASASRQKQFQVLRQALRLQCECTGSDLVNGRWNIKKIHQLIKTLNKSGCYRDEIHQIQNDPIIIDLLWMERDGNTKLKNTDKEDQVYTEIDQRGYKREK